MIKTVEETLEEMGSIALEKLINPIHRELIKDTLINARQCEALVEDLPEELAALEEAYEVELAASHIEDTIHRMTTEIAKDAEDRSFAQTALKSAIRGVMGLSNPEKVDAAKQLFELMHKYDLHVGQSTDAQTAMIDSFISDVESRYLPLMELIGQMELYNELKAKNEAVCAKVIKRDNAKVGLGVGRMENARKATDDAFRALRRGVNSFAFVNGYSRYAHFIGYMNVLMTRYKRVHLSKKVQSPEAVPGETLPGEGQQPGTGEGQQPGTNPGGSTQQPGGETQEPTKYWLTLKFADNTQEDAEYEAGATIQYPTPTTGYRWPTTAPTVMPAHDVTVTEERNPNQPPPATGGGESGFD